jgi:polysaccharide biosynthesis protein PslH
MRILQICFRPPFPLKDGGAIAMFNISKGLLDAGCELTLLIPLTEKHNIAPDEIPSVLNKSNAIHTLKINTHITVWGAFLNLFTSKPYYLSRYDSKKFRASLIEILKSEEFDIILIESLKMSMYEPVARKYSSAKVVLRSHNVEFKIWERMASAATNPVKRWYLDIMVKRLKKYELSSMDHFDALLPITSVDGDFFVQSGCNKPVFTTPCGIDFSRLKKSPAIPEKNSLFHLGALDWMPNIEAVEWFLRDIWPLIHSKYPDVKFYLAGRNMPDHIKNINLANVVISGEVEDAVAFINSKQIMMVPLISGSGMRIKIAEGLALGKAIISTTIGAEGIEYENGKNMLIADSPEDFSEAVGKIINDEKFAARISEEAYVLAGQQYDNIQIILKLLNNLNSLQ